MVIIILIKMEVITRIAIIKIIKIGSTNNKDNNNSNSNNKEIKITIKICKINRGIISNLTLINSNHNNLIWIIKITGGMLITWIILVIRISKTSIKIMVTIINRIIITTIKIIINSSNNNTSSSTTRTKTRRILIKISKITTITIATTIII